MDRATEVEGGQDAEGGEDLRRSKIRDQELKIRTSHNYSSKGGRISVNINFHSQQPFKTEKAFPNRKSNNAGGKESVLSAPEFRKKLNNNK